MENKSDSSRNPASVGVSNVEEKKDPEIITSTTAEPLINASGHRQELDRNFNLLSICSLGIATGNTWIALGGSITVAIYNGGPPGVLYEFIVVSIMYCTCNPNSLSPNSGMDLKKKDDCLRRQKP